MWSGFREQPEDTEHRNWWPKLVFHFVGPAKTFIYWTEHFYKQTTQGSDKCLLHVAPHSMIVFFCFSFFKFEFYRSVLNFYKHKQLEWWAGINFTHWFWCIMEIWESIQLHKQWLHHLLDGLMVRFWLFFLFLLEKITTAQYKFNFCNKLKVKWFGFEETVQFAVLKITCYRLLEEQQNCVCNMCVCGVHVGVHVCVVCMLVCMCVWCACWCACVCGVHVGVHVCVVCMLVCMCVWCACWCAWVCGVHVCVSVTFRIQSNTYICQF